jgi:hypothetical protein
MLLQRHFVDAIYHRNEIVKLFTMCQIPDIHNPKSIADSYDSISLYWRVLIGMCHKNATTKFNKRTYEYLMATLWQEHIASICIDRHVRAKFLLGKAFRAGYPTPVRYCARETINAYCPFCACNSRHHSRHGRLHKHHQTPRKRRQDSGCPHFHVSGLALPFKFRASHKVAKGGACLN